VEFALYYTLAAIVVYFLAAWILDRIEIAYGKRFAYRNYVFFFIIFALAYAALTAINPEPSIPEQQESQSLTDKPGQ